MVIVSFSEILKELVNIHRGHRLMGSQIVFIIKTIKFIQIDKFPNYFFILNVRLWSFVISIYCFFAIRFILSQSNHIKCLSLR
jgi:hypothetical protein